MDVSVADAKNRLSELLRSVEAGDDVTITRNGKLVAQLIPPPRERRKVRFGTMRGLIRTTPVGTPPLPLIGFSRVSFERISARYEYRNTRDERTGANFSAGPSRR